MSRIEVGGRSLTTIEIQDLLATDHPLVAQFRFERTQRFGRTDELAFSLHIIPRAGARYVQQRDASGRRVRPVWRTLTGRERIGEATRAIRVEGDELVAENLTFFPNQEYNDLGIGSALYVSLERFYRALGIRRVGLLAVDVGVYVWARQAFAFAAPSWVGTLVPELQRFLGEHGRAVKLDLKNFRDSWDLANHEEPGLLVDEQRAGKAFMLARAPSWNGLKLLDDEQHRAVAEASRRETFARLPSKIEGAPATLAVR
jgi:hypothetical protein